MIRRIACIAGKSVVVFGLVAAMLPIAASPSSADVFVEQLIVNVSHPNGTNSSVPLDPSKAYRIEATGSFRYGVNDGVADAECANLGSGTPYQRNVYGAVLNLPDPLDLVVNGQAQEWVPTDGTQFGCDGSDPRAYTISFQPPSAGVLNFRVLDTNNFDNQGSLAVKIFERNGPAVSPPVSILQLVDTVAVLATAHAGINSIIPVLAGETYLVEAAGTYTYANLNPAPRADAECATPLNDPNTWSRNQFGLLGTQDHLDLLVNGASVDWVATTVDGAGCNSATHRYQAVVVPVSTGQLNLRVLDSNYSDNNGTVMVKIFRKIL